MPKQDVSKLKISSARQVGNLVEATVEFEDGLSQTVSMPDWVDKEDLKQEAARLRADVEARAKAKRRTDLED